MSHSAYVNPKILKFPFPGLNSNGAAIHFNPNYRKNGNVFVNPLFVNAIQTITQPNVRQISEPVAAKVPIPINSNKYSWKRKNDDEAKTSTKIVTKCGKKLIRKSLTPLHQLPSKATKQTLATKFKIDKRPLQEHTPNRKKANSSHQIQNLKNVYTVNKQLKTKDLTKGKNQSTNKKLIKIGGILYRATSKKLTRAPVPSSSSVKPKQGTKPRNKLIININGQSFMRSRNGATLKRVRSDCLVAHKRQRVDFGGVTYKQTTENTFVRTNAHQVRSVLTQARQKSLACLAARRRKINTPCEIFRKLGSCARYQSGICVYTHDKKNIDLCKRFLQGKCIDTACVLSHEIVHQKVPTCKYFLNGSCGRDNCPYLHVKVSERADICLPFLQGYCTFGDKCSQRHENICPEYEKIGFCKKGKKCPYPHKKAKKVKRKTKRKLKLVEKKKRLEGNDGDKGDGVRYYAAESETSGNKELVVPKKQRLESLPAFIAFKS